MPNPTLLNQPEPLNLMFKIDFEPEDADYMQMCEDDLRAEAEYERHEYRDECERDEPNYNDYDN